MTSIDDVKKALGEFADDFNFAVEGVFIVARAKAFIPSKEAFAEIAKRMRSVKGEWISTGKGDKTAHWRIPTGTVEANPKLTVVVNHVQKAQQLMTQALDELKQAGY